MSQKVNKKVLVKKIIPLCLNMESLKIDLLVCRVDNLEKLQTAVCSNSLMALNALKINQSSRKNLFSIPKARNLFLKRQKR
jgi:hypothetical protein